MIETKLEGVVSSVSSLGKYVQEFITEQRAQQRPKWGLGISIFGAFIFAAGLILSPYASQLNQNADEIVSHKIELALIKQQMQLTGGQPCGR